MTDVYRKCSLGELDELVCTRCKSNHNPVPTLFRVTHCIKLRQISPVQSPSSPSPAYPNLYAITIYIKIHWHVTEVIWASISAKAERIVRTYSIAPERILLFFLHPHFFLQFPKLRLHIRRGKSKVSKMRCIY